MNKMDLMHLARHYPDVDLSKAIWGFTCFSRQNYAEGYDTKHADEIIIGLHNSSESIFCKLAIRWYPFAGEKPLPRLECFSDAWPLMMTATFERFFQKLFDSQNEAITSDEVSRLLLDCGFRDLSDKPLPDFCKGGGKA